jgi:CHASE2 domain-containing sensor protein
MNDLSTNHVVITDIKMPFISMVVFMVKWAIAAIPALIILAIFGAIIAGVLGGMVAS